jgi:hypothetical protein
MSYAPENDEIINCAVFYAELLVMTIVMTLLQSAILISLTFHGVNDVEHHNQTHAHE